MKAEDDLMLCWTEILYYDNFDYHIACDFDWSINAYQLTVSGATNDIIYCWERKGPCEDRLSIMATEPEDYEHAQWAIGEAIKIIQNGEDEE